MDSVNKTLNAMSVLVVDDMEAMRSMVGGCLKGLGALNLHFAPNGQVAWKLLQTQKIQMIICDWDMPEVSGIELLKLVKGSEQHKHIPFLMLTATTEKKSVLDALEAGVNDYLSKPFKPKELEYRIIKLTRKVTH